MHACTHLAGVFAPLFEEPLGVVQRGASGQHDEVRAAIANVSVGGHSVGGLHATAGMHARHDAGELAGNGFPFARVNSWGKQQVNSVLSSDTQ